MIKNECETPYQCLTSFPIKNIFDELRLINKFFMKVFYQIRSERQYPKHFLYFNPLMANPTKLSKNSNNLSVTANSRLIV